MKDTKTTNDLAKRLKKGDAKAAEAIFDEYAPVLHRFFAARLNNRESAQDLTQECFIRLLKHIDQFDCEQGNFQSWFWRIARNLLIDTYRQARPVQSLETMEAAGFDAPDLADRMIPNIELRRVLETVKTFPDEDQELFYFYFIADIAYPEIAELTGKSEANLRVAIHRLRKRIIQAYDQGI